jgi:uncharacterized membrane protein
MPVARYVYVLALVVWLGGMVTIGGVVAPTAFRSLEQHDPVDGRTRAATLVGDVLRQFHTLAYVAGGLMVAALVAMRIVGPRPPGFGLRVTLIALMLTATAATGWLIDPQIVRLRASVGVPMASLPEGDARRIQFGRLHAVSTSLMGLAIASGLVLCLWEARE